MKKALLVCLCAISLASFFGCGGDTPSSNATVQGLVVDTSLNPIPGATVVIGASSSTTGSNGSFTLSNVTSGLQTLSVSVAGYISATKQLTVSALETNNVPMIILERRDSKSTTIGSGGGEVLNTDGTVKLIIPENALTSDQTITVTSCDLLSAPSSSPSGYKIVYLVYITPVDISLEKKAILAIPVPSGVSAASFFRFNPSSLSWDTLGSGTVSSTDISIEISNFGWIAAAVPLGTSYGSVTGRIVSSTGSGISGASVWYFSQIVATDGSGYYSLSNLPADTISVNASAVGYNPSSVSVVVQAGTTVTAPDIVLSSSSSLYGSVSGKVLSASTSSPVSGARVTAGGKTAYTDSSGNYTVSDLSPGTATVNVYAYGYLNESSTVAVTAGRSASLDFSLDLYSATTFTDDFETDNGWWSFTSLWNRVYNPGVIPNIWNPAYVLLPDSGYLPSAHSGSYACWFGNPADGSYIGGQSSTDTPNSGGTSDTYSYKGYLTSPSISLAGYSVATLSFWTWWEIESRSTSSTGTTFDVMEVEVSDDGASTWTKLARLNPDYNSPDTVNIPYSSGGFNKAGKWIKYQYDLTAYAGKTIKIRFFFDTFDANSNGFRGWLIDDVSVDANVINPASKKSR